MLAKKIKNENDGIISIYDVVRIFREKHSIDNLWDIKSNIEFRDHGLVIFTIKIENEKGWTVSKSNSIFTIKMATQYDVEAVAVARALRYAGFVEKPTKEEIEYNEKSQMEPFQDKDPEPSIQEEANPTEEKDPLKEFGLPPDLGLGIEIVDGRAYVIEEIKDAAYKNRQLLSQCGFDLDRQMKPKRWFKELN